MAETGKQLMRSSGSSSDESDPAKDEGASNLKRSFECTYCKRGFTNAQALGGHMNIHRKDRAKAAKQITAVTKKGNIYSDDPNNYMMSCRQITPMETGYENWEARRPTMSSHDHMYRPAAVLSSGVLNYNTMPAAGGYSSEYHRPPGHHHYLEPNLSLRVGPAASNNVAWNNNNNTEDDNHEEGKNEDVDLELRLGPR
ncbi:hypothetical protein QQ045_009116 [Rhodiola kirilowii]